MRLSMQAFQSRLEVSNYAMKARSEEKLQELERIKALRRIEIAEEKVCTVLSVDFILII